MSYRNMGASYYWPYFPWPVCMPKCDLVRHYVSLIFLPHFQKRWCTAGRLEPRNLPWENRCTKHYATSAPKYARKYLFSGSWKSKIWSIVLFCKIETEEKQKQTSVARHLITLLRSFRNISLQFLIVRSCGELPFWQFLETTGECETQALDKSRKKISALKWNVIEGYLQ